jgi:hypothetical protein
MNITFEYNNISNDFSMDVPNWMNKNTLFEIRKQDLKCKTVYCSLFSYVYLRPRKKLEACVCFP